MGGGGRPSNTRACEKRRREKISFVDSVSSPSGGEAQTSILRLKLGLRLRLKLRLCIRAWPTDTQHTHEGRLLPPLSFPFPFGYNSTATNTS